MNKYIGKIIIVTNMRKIPRSCAECGYYDGMGNRPGGRYNDGICTAGASIYSTRGIRVSKERLKNCPLHMIGRDSNDHKNKACKKNILIALDSRTCSSNDGSHCPCNRGGFLLSA